MKRGVVWMSAAAGALAAFTRRRVVVDTYRATQILTRSGMRAHSSLALEDKPDDPVTLAHIETGVP